MMTTDRASWAMEKVEGIDVFGSIVLNLVHGAQSLCCRPRAAYGSQGRVDAHHRHRDADAMFRAVGRIWL
jgi:hypothetical protein